tara:strand:- start:56 stop:805 length:750 start_codon:yes stop_codon:yes gene_type:complete
MKKFIKKILPNYLVNLISKYIQLNILNNIKSDVKNISYTNKSNILSELCEKYGSDKGFINIDIDKKPYKWHPHTYTTYYHSMFNLSRENIKYVFECGLGTNNPNFKSNMTENGIPGASHRVWRDYFFNAKIYGGDIDKSVLFEEDRIKTFYVDQLDTNSIKSMWKNIEVEKFDIIIDDGLHEPEANYNFFINSFHKLKKNGVFVIEDVPNNCLFYLQKKLKNYNIDIVVGFTKTKKIYKDNNLIIIRKS